MCASAICSFDQAASATQPDNPSVNKSDLLGLVTAHWSIPTLTVILFLQQITNQFFRFRLANVILLANRNHN
jgi:hypothetical protein